MQKVNSHSSGSFIEDDPEEILMERVNRLHQKINCLSNYHAKTIGYQIIPKVFISKDSSFEHDLDKFVYQKIPTASRLCAKILTKNDPAFTCQECHYEENSIYCIECFQNSDHVGHRFKKIISGGGCCDCGDDEKTKFQGHCKNHIPNNDIKIEVDAHIEAVFCDQMGSLIDILLTIGLEVDTLHELAKIDSFGKILFQKLRFFNEGSLVSGVMTKRLLMSPMNPGLQQYEAMTRMEMIFELNRLPMTARTVLQLCISMFQVPDFRRELTIIFLRVLNNCKMYQSGFKQLDCQLLTSHKTILELIRSDPPKIKPLSLLLNITDPQKLTNSCWNFFFDIKMLLRLHGDSGLHYIRYHLAESNITELLKIRILGDQNPQLARFYGIETACFDLVLLEMIRMILKNSREEEPILTLKVLQKPLLELANFIFFVLECEQPSVYYSHQRLFSLMLFAYLEGDIDRLDNYSEMEHIISILEFTECDIYLKLNAVIQRTLKVFVMHGKTMDNLRLINDFYTYYFKVFKSESIIVQLDSIFLRILLKIANFFGKPYNIFEGSEIKKSFDLVFREIDKLPTNAVAQDIFQTQKQVKSLSNLIGLLVEAQSSNAADISIRSHLKIDDPLNIEKMYLTLLASSNKITKKQFSTLAKIFFHEPKNLRQFFVKFESKTEPTKLQNVSTNLYFGINIGYLRSLRIRIQGISEMNHPFNRIPFFFNQNCYHNFLPTAKQCIRIVQALMRVMVQPALHSPVQELIDLIIRQLWKIYVLSKPDVPDFLRNFFKQLPNFNIAEVSLAKQIQEQFQQIEPRRKASSSNVQEQNKAATKRRLMKQKRENILKQYDIPVQTEDMGQICSICKASEPVEQMTLLCYQEQASLSLTNATMIRTCNHEAHLSCLRKKQPQTLICPICSFVGNISLPCNMHFANENGNQAFVFQTLMKLFQLGLCLQKNTLPEHVLSKLVTSLIFQIATVGLTNPKLFSRTISPVYSCIFPRFLSYTKISFNEESQLPKKTHNKFEQILQVIRYKMANKIQNAENSLKSKKFESDIVDLNVIEPTILARVDQIMEEIFRGKSNQQSIELSPQAKSICSRFHEHPELPLNLTDLFRQYAGACPNCLQKTDTIIICLRCRSFRTCIQCKAAQASSHMHQMHGDCSIFLAINTGIVYYTRIERTLAMKSIYEDYKNDAYQSLGNQALDRTEFTLNRKAYEKILKDIHEFNIRGQMYQQERIHGPRYVLI